MKHTPGAVALLILLPLACSQRDAGDESSPATGTTLTGSGFSLTRVAIVGADDQTGAIADLPFTVAQDSRGNVYVGWGGSGSVPVFDATGKLVRHLGRKGSGPGEFLSAGIVHVGRGDTIRVFDGQNARLTVLTPDGQVVKTVAIPRMLDGATQLPSGEMVMTAYVDGHRGHFIDADGNIKSSFADVTWSGPPGMAPRITLAPDSVTGGLVSASRSAYEIRTWSRDGKLTQTFTRAPDWFVVVSEAEYPEKGPSSSLGDIARAPNGGFWVIGHTSTSIWKALIAKARAGEEFGKQNLPPPDSLFRSTLELLDQRGDSVGAIVLPGYGLRALSNGLIATYREKEDGFPIIELWRPRIVTSR